MNGSPFRFEPEQEKTLPASSRQTLNFLADVRRRQFAAVAHMEGIENFDAVYGVVLSIWLFDQTKQTARALAEQIYGADYFGADEVFIEPHLFLTQFSQN